MKSTVDESFNEILTKLSKQVAKWSESDFDDLNMKTIDKYRIVSLFLDAKDRKALENARGNHGGYKKDNMSYLYPEIFTKLFIAICKLHTNPLNELEQNNKLSKVAFNRLIENKEKEYDELRDEIEELEEKLDGKDMVSQEQYNSTVKQLNDQINIQANQIEKLEQKLKEKEDYYKLKITATEQRMRAKLEMENKIIDSQKQNIEY
jgi:predicted RNase H-like nuclease (RuvC/YqgF family)